MDRVASDLSALKDALGRWDPDQVLSHEELDFLDRIEKKGHLVRWIPKSKDGLPTNDFVWLTQDNEQCELKSPKKAKRSTIIGAIRDAVRDAAKQDVTKDCFVIDLGKRRLGPTLERHLRGYNEARETYHIRRLWVVAENGEVLTELTLE